MDLHTIISHILLSCILSFIIGFERELRNQPAGIRTHILIGVGSTLFMIISILLPEMWGNQIKDPGRIAAQVVTGVGFIGAGAIMRMGLNTKGLTTAANIWVVSAIGLAVGAGLYMLAIFVTGIILLNLIIITKIKTKFFIKRRYFNINIVFEEKDKIFEKILKKINEFRFNIIQKSIENKRGKTYLKIFLYSKENIDSLYISSKLRPIKEIKNISIQEE